MNRFEKIPLIIKGVSLDNEKQRPSIILKNKDGSITIPIEIGPSAACAIIDELEGIHSVRPKTHDLFAQILNQNGINLTQLEIYKYDNGIYYSRLHYKKRFRRFCTEVRPSDGLALIIRHHGKILTYSHVIESQANRYWIYKENNHSNEFLTFM